MKSTVFCRAQAAPAASRSAAVAGRPAPVELEQVAVDTWWHGQGEDDMTKIGSEHWNYGICDGDFMGFYGDFMGFYGDFMGCIWWWLNGDFMGFSFTNKSWLKYGFLTTKNEDFTSRNRDFSQDLATENGDSNLTHSEFSDFFPPMIGDCATKIGIYPLVI